MAHFPRLFQYFASPGNTRYEWDRTGPISATNARRVKRPASVRSFRLRRSFCNIKPKYVNMADINVTSKGSAASTNLADPSAPGAAPKTPLEPIWDIIELLFFAYRDFVGDPDEVLLKLSFGRAHHRVLHFVNRNPGMKVADLLEISQHHQTVAWSRTQAIGRPGIRGAKGRCAGPSTKIVIRDSERRNAGT